jgi:prepilin-type N-terminal cleavage/methylation domain-containing protein
MLGWLKRLRADQNGFSLPEVMVATMINGACLTAIASGVIVFALMQKTVTDTGVSAMEVTLAETAWRADMGEATTVTVTSASEVRVIAPGSGGVCRDVRWFVTAGEVQRTIVNYPTTSAGSGSCSGTAGYAVTNVILSNVAAGAGFQFQNLVGRGLTFTNGTPTAASGEKPAGVSEKAWADTTIGTGALVATATTADVVAELRVIQLGTALHVAGDETAESNTSDAGATHATK